MNLVFFRHGKAEERGKNDTDDERELTPKGRDKLRSAASGLRAIVPKRSKCVIWTSPLPRARQSAEILADVLRIDELINVEAIASGELDAIVPEWSLFEPDEWLIVVGHAPHLSDWCLRITGHALPFKKGAAAWIVVESLIPASGTLHFFAQPKVLAQIGRGAQ